MWPGESCSRVPERSRRRANLDFKRLQLQWRRPKDHLGPASLQACDVKQSTSLNLKPQASSSRTKFAVSTGKPRYIKVLIKFAETIQTLPQDSYLLQARTAFSMCSGALTAEMSRAVLQQYVRATGYDMDIRTVALWASCIN